MIKRGRLRLPEHLAYRKYASVTAMAVGIAGALMAWLLALI